MDEIERGRQARRLLADEVLMEAITEVKADTIAAWMHGETLEDREKAHAKILAADAVHEMLETYVGDVESFEATQPDDEEQIE